MGYSVAARFVAFLNKLSVVIFIVAVIFIIYFVARYIKCSNRRSSTAFRRALRNHLAQENPSIVDMPVGLEREIIEALPTFVYKPQHMKTVLDCAVCLCAFQENENGRMLPNCNHSFHIDCIDMWLFSHSTCPNCRAKVEAFSSGKKPESGVSEELGAVSGCGHGSKDQSSSSSADMDEAKPLPETAIDISDRF